MDDEGEILIDSIEPISLQDITHDLATESGFQSRADLLKVAKHGSGENVYSPHSFRVTTITVPLEQNVPREDVQHLAGHADPRTTNLYDRRERKIKKNIVERISV